MERFLDERYLALWAGSSLGNNESAGDKFKHYTRRKWLKLMAIQCAWAAIRTKGTYLRNKYDSMAGRRGKKRALVAVGHKIIIAAYFILKNKKSYMEFRWRFFG